MNPLLDKFDKEIDEMTVSIADNFQPFEDKIAGKKTEQVLVLETAAELLLPAIKKEIKSLAHSHLEEAYRAGKEEGVILGQLKPLEKANEKAKEVIENIYQQGFKAGQQSNLERLIEKCGDKGETINLDIQPDGTTKAENESGNLGFGSTPTEAVENLIKALNL